MAQDANDRTRRRPVARPRRVRECRARLPADSRTANCKSSAHCLLSARQEGPTSQAIEPTRGLQPGMVAPVIPADPAAAPPGTGMNYARLYDYRFRDVDQAGRQAVWREIASTCTPGWTSRSAFSTRRRAAASSSPAVPAAERWGVDLVRQGRPRGRGVRMIIADIMDAELPDGYFDGVFLSNFLEHLPSQDTVAAVLGKLRAAMSPGGRIAVIGPNFRYCRARVLRLRRPHRDPHPRVDGRAPVRRRIRGRAVGPAVPAVLLPRPAARRHRG